MLFTGSFSCTSLALLSIGQQYLVHIFLNFCFTKIETNILVETSIDLFWILCIACKIELILLLFSKGEDTVFTHKNKTEENECSSSRLWKRDLNLFLWMIESLI